MIATSVAGTKLTAGCLRPRLAAASVATFSLLDVLAGRITFAAGVAFAAWAVVALLSRRVLPTVALSILAFAVSPLAGLFLGVVAAVVAALDPTRGAICIVVGCCVAGARSWDGAPVSWYGHDALYRHPCGAPGGMLSCRREA